MEPHIWFVLFQCKHLAGLGQWSVASSHFYLAHPEPHAGCELCRNTSDFHIPSSWPQLSWGNISPCIVGLRLTLGWLLQLQEERQHWIDGELLIFMAYLSVWRHEQPAQGKTGPWWARLPQQEKALSHLAELRRLNKFFGLNGVYPNDFEVADVFHLSFWNCPLILTKAIINSFF